MQYQDIKTKARFLTSTNSASFTDADIVILANNAVEHIEALINASDSRWEFDDTNQTDIPIATATITSGQQDYSLATSHISIDRVEIKDSTGNWRLLTPIDQHDVRFQALAEGETTRSGAYYATNGIPLQYDKMASTIYLFPTPNYTQASSLKIYFTRPPVAFVVGDTSAQPGFNSLFHDLVSYWIAYEFAMANGKANQNTLFQAIQAKEQNMIEFYGLRSRDERPRMGVSTDGITGAVSGVLGSTYGLGASDSNR